MYDSYLIIVKVRIWATHMTFTYRPNVILYGIGSEILSWIYAKHAKTDMELVSFPLECV